jgi:hypothetical protein
MEEEGILLSISLRRKERLVKIWRKGRRNKSHRPFLTFVSLTARAPDSN